MTTKKGLFGGMFGGSKKNLMAAEPPAAAPPTSVAAAAQGSRMGGMKITAKQRSRPSQDVSPPSPQPAPVVASQSKAPNISLSSGYAEEKASTPSTAVSQEIGASSSGLLIPVAPSIAARNLGRDSKSPTVGSARSGSPKPPGLPIKSPARSIGPVGGIAVPGDASAPLTSSLSKIQGLESLRPRTINTTTSGSVIPPSQSNPEPAKASLSPQRPQSTRAGSSEGATTFRSSLMQNMMDSAPKPLPESSLADIANYSPPRKSVEEIEREKIQALEIVVGDDDASVVSSLSAGSGEYAQPKNMKKPHMMGASIDISCAEADNDTSNRVVKPVHTANTLKDDTGVLDKSSNTSRPQPIENPVTSFGTGLTKQVSPMRQRYSGEKNTAVISPASNAAGEQKKDEKIMKKASGISTPKNSGSFLENLNRAMSESGAEPNIQANVVKVEPTSSSARKAAQTGGGGFLAALAASASLPEQVEPVPAPQIGSGSFLVTLSSPPPVSSEPEAKVEPEGNVYVREGGQSAEGNTRNSRNPSLNTAMDTLCVSFDSHRFSEDEDNVKPADNDNGEIGEIKSVTPPSDPVVTMGDIEPVPSIEKVQAQRHTRNVSRDSGEESLDEVWPWLRDAISSKVDLDGGGSNSHVGRAASRGELTMSSQQSPRLASAASNLNSSIGANENNQTILSLASGDKDSTGLSAPFDPSISISMSEIPMAEEDIVVEREEEKPEFDENENDMLQEQDKDIHESNGSVQSGLEADSSVKKASASAGGVFSVDPDRTEEKPAILETPNGVLIYAEAEPAIERNTGEELTSDIAEVVPVNELVNNKVLISSPISTDPSHPHADIRAVDILSPTEIDLASNNAIVAEAESPAKAVHIISEAMSRNDDIFSNLLALIDKGYVEPKPSAAKQKKSEENRESKSSAVIPATPERMLGADVPLFSEVKSSYDRALKPSSSELDAAYHRAMGRMSAPEVEHQRMMRSINSLSAVLEDKKPSPDINELLAPNWNLQLHLRHSLGPEALSSAPSLEQADRITDSMNSFVSSADGISRGRWANVKVTEPVTDVEAVTGIAVPPPIEDYCRPFSHSLANRLGDGDIDRQIFATNHDPARGMGALAIQERYMKDEGEMRLKEGVDAVRKALNSSLDLLDAALPHISPVVNDAEELHMSYDEGYPVLDSSMQLEDLGFSDEFIGRNIDSNSSAQNMDTLSDIITNAVMSAAHSLAVDDEYYYEADADYPSVKERELRFDGKDFKFNSLMQFTITEAEESMDKSRTLFDMCDSDIDQLFELGRSVAEAGTHDTYLNTMLKSSHRVRHGSKQSRTGPSPADQYTAMSQATKNIDAEIDLSPFIDISVNLKPKIQHGKYVFDATAAPLSSSSSRQPRRHSPAEQKHRNSSKAGSPRRHNTSSQHRSSMNSSSARHDFSDDLSQYSVNTSRSRGSTNGMRMDRDSSRKWSKPVEYNRAGSPGRVSSVSNMHDELCTPMRQSRSRSPSPSYMSPYYYAGHVLSNYSF